MNDDPFGIAYVTTLSWEGGWSDDPADPGGKTYKGVTLNTLALWWQQQGRNREPGADDLRAMTENDRRALYRGLFWDPIKGDALPVPFAMTAFDYAVHSGPNKAIRDLQEVVGASSDGIVGPITIRAIDRHPHADALWAYGAGRLAYLERLPGHQRFGDGWRRRVLSVHATAAFQGGLFR